MIHNQIKKLRLDQNLSQQQIADLLFMSQAAYSKIESGQTSIKIDTLIRILDVFKEKAADILSNYGIKLIHLANKKDMQAEISLDNFYQYYKQVLDEMLMIKNKEINELKETISYLKKENNNK